MNNAKELFFKAQDQQLTTIAGYRLAVVKASDELRSFNGEDNYQIAVATIVKEYPEGIVLTRLREVLPDSIVLDKAVKELIEKKEITTESYGKRTQLLKPLSKPAAQPAKERIESVDTNPTGDPKWDQKSAQSANTGTPVQDITEE